MVEADGQTSRAQTYIDERDEDEIIGLEIDDNHEFE